MELAVRSASRCASSTLPAGKDPADAAQDFERLAASVGYLRHRVQLELANPSSQEAFERIQRMIDDAPPEPERDEAARLASDRLQVPLRIAGGSAGVVGEASELLGAGDRLERDFAAICAAPS